MPTTHAHALVPGQSFQWGNTVLTVTHVEPNGSSMVQVFCEGGVAFDLLRYMSVTLR